MPTAFVDGELINNFNSLNKSSENVLEEKYPAHAFEASCLRVGITLDDLKKRTYVSIMKVPFSFLYVDNSTKENHRNATQKDIDKFMS